MKILLTGGSSLTGAWFVRALAAAGHQVVAVHRRPAAEAYRDLRGRRIALVARHAEQVFGCSFGDDGFLKLIGRAGPWDLLAHHAAETTNYQSDRFDVAAAVAANTANLPAVLGALRDAGCTRVLLTGSIFERGEGKGTDPLPAISPYGISKTLTRDAFGRACRQAGMTLGRLVIPNPFGPLEERGFTYYLARCWLGGQTPTVRTPLYVRDNIHVDLLARAYADFASRLTPDARQSKLNPTGYRETQGDFARRFAEAMRPRLGRPCPLQFAEQTDFPQPRVRVNTDVPDAAALGFDENRAWDELAAFYRQHFADRMG